MLLISIIDSYSSQAFTVSKGACRWIVNMFPDRVFDLLINAGIQGTLLTRKESRSFIYMKNIQIAKAQNFKCDAILDMKNNTRNLSLPPSLPPSLSCLPQARSPCC